MLTQVTSGCLLTIHSSNVFLGLALDKLGKTDQAEKAYLAASRIKNNDKTAWQGLVSLYEQQGSNKLDAYREVTLKLGQIFADSYEDQL
jgi:superkiller protein 3